MEKPLSLVKSVIQMLWLSGQETVNQLPMEEDSGSKNQEPLESWLSMTV